MDKLRNLVQRRKIMSEIHIEQANHCKKDSKWLHAYRKFKTPPYFVQESKGEIKE